MLKVGYNKDESQVESLAMTRKLTAKTLARKFRDRTMVDLFIRGWTRAAIAEELGMSENGVRKRLRKLFSTMDTEEDLRTWQRRQQEQIQKLEKMIHATVKEKGSIALGEIDRLLKLMERMAKLKGLDRPTKVALTDPTGQEEWQPEGYEVLQRALMTGDFTLPDEDTTVATASE